MEHNIDRLIDSAFAKDRSTLPAQPGVPGASLLSALEASVPAAQSPVASAGAQGAAVLGISKFFLVITGSLLLGVISYVVGNSQIQFSNSNNPMIFFSQDSLRQRKPADPVQKKETQIIGKAEEKISAPIAPADSVSLIMPQSIPKKYPSDSTRVPIRKPH
ncbi:MAG: hypothetical protein ABI778_08030 [Ignavibacteriota bacterium]